MLYDGFFTHLIKTCEQDLLWGFCTTGIGKILKIERVEV